MEGRPDGGALIDDMEPGDAEATGERVDKDGRAASEEGETVAGYTEDGGEVPLMLCARAVPRSDVVGGKLLVSNVPSCGDFLVVHLTRSPVSVVERIGGDELDEKVAELEAATDKRSVTF